MRASPVAILTVVASVVASVAFAQVAGQPTGGQRQQRTPEERAAAAEAERVKMMAMPRPIEAADTVFIEELTWLEVRDAIKGGKNTVIVTTGGMEQNGPYLATGKHNYVNRATCEAIARKLGNALCAPNVPFVPEGNFEPPTDMMRFPGSISLSDATYRALLSDIATSLKVNGFEHVILIGDSGGNQAGMKQVAVELNTKWAGGKTRIHFIPEYYDYAAAYKWAAATFGWKEVPEGHHDDPTITTIMMTVNPDHVRHKQRLAKDKASINGISIADATKAVEWGKQLVNYRADVTVAAIKKSLAATGTSQ